jgi:hypothetical protein
MKKLMKTNGVAMFVMTDNKLLVRVEMSGISPLVALTDGMRLYKFGRDDNIYLDMYAVMDWFARQLELAEIDGCDHALRGDYKKSVSSCERIIDAYEKGEIELL